MHTLLEIDQHDLAFLGKDDIARMNFSVYALGQWAELQPGVEHFNQVPEPPCLLPGPLGMLSEEVKVSSCQAMGHTIFNSGKPFILMAGYLMDLSGPFKIRQSPMNHPEVAGDPSNII